jgi:hypothetical protein
VRLGKVDRQDIDAEQCVFTDNPDAARYGYITVNALDKEFINFTYTCYSFDGKQPLSSQFTVQLDEKADINGDGLVDVTYTRPFRKRPGMENAVYLTFLSSQEDRNTSMFAVLPDQYSRGVYPSGIIGINPDERFIVTKYENQTTAKRVAVQGIVYGDYAVDYQTGKYQKVSGNGKYRFSRSIDDSDLTDVELSERMDGYFYIEEFDDVFSAENLFNALPEIIRERFIVAVPTSGELIPVLNQILESYDLIETVASVKEVDLTGVDLLDVKASIHSISLNELIVINRLFISENYADVCPPVQTQPDNIAFILPLLHCVIRGDGEDDVNDAFRAVGATYTDYSQKKNSLRSRFSSYHLIGKIPKLDIPLPNVNIKNPTTETEIQIGIFGVVENNWGSSIKLGVSAAAFIQLEFLKINLSKTFEKKSLLPKPIEIKNIANIQFWISAVYISIEAPVKFDIDFEIGGNLSLTTPIFVGFTGLYGAGAYIGANYGISWKKAWFVSIPTGFKFNPYFKGETVSDFAFYAGPIDNSITPALFAPVISSLPTAVTNASIYVALTPKLMFNPNVSAWKIISLGLSVDTGLQGKFEVSALQNAKKLLEQNKLPVTGKASLNFVGDIYGTGYVGLDLGSILCFNIGFIGWKFNSEKIKSFSYEVIKPYTVF